jgi:hypothetical protein
MVVVFLHQRIAQKACKGRCYHSLSARNINPSIQPLEFPKCAWWRLGSTSLPRVKLSWAWVVLLCLGWAWDQLGTTPSCSDPSPNYFVCNLRFGLLTNGELAPFLTPSLWLGSFCELLLLTSSLWPQGVLMSLLWENCEWNRVEERGIYSVGKSLWCWHLFTCIWWLRWLCNVLNRLSSLESSSDTYKSCIC